MAKRAEPSKSRGCGIHDAKKYPLREEKRRAESALKENEQLMRSLLNSFPSAALLLSPDDEVTLVQLNKQILEHLNDTVTARTSSIEALEAFQAIPTQFDFVITDMNMPNMTGDILTRELLKIRPDLPVILCTGFSEKISKSKSEQIGIRKLLMKPVITSELAKGIRQTLDTS